ncbi:MAG: hypothetical protein RH949_19950 [Coleofasciculus sp. A1-SPW-01]|uniref:hypothetical protein n=1 Tax=Coleofasciculus sp. A1-SPW-01 TaxID=3070819 RepID=UPI00330394DC
MKYYLLVRGCYLISEGDELEIIGLREALEAERSIPVKNLTKDMIYPMTHSLSPRQVEIMLCGGLINHFKAKSQVAQSVNI